MGFDHGTWDGGDWAAMTTIMLFFWGGAIVLAWWIVRRLRADQSRPGSDAGLGHADELLAERFARGEIDGEQFSRSRELLHSAAPSSRRGAT